MQIAVIFTKEELILISRALTYGIIHADKNEEEKQMKQLEQKINMLGAIQQGR